MECLCVQQSRFSAVQAPLLTVQHRSIILPPSQPEHRPQPLVYSQPARTAASPKWSGTVTRSAAASRKGPSQRARKWSQRWRRTSLAQRKEARGTGWVAGIIGGAGRCGRTRLLAPQQDWGTQSARQCATQAAGRTPSDQTHLCAGMVQPCPHSSRSGSPSSSGDSRMGVRGVACPLAAPTPPAPLPPPPSLAAHSLAADEPVEQAVKSLCRRCGQERSPAAPCGVGGRPSGRPAEARGGGHAPAPMTSEQQQAL